jgi:hypothetical protein
MSQITLDSVEHLMESVEHLISVARATAEHEEGLSGEAVDTIRGVGQHRERVRILELWLAFHESLRDLELANALRLGAQVQFASLALARAIAMGDHVPVERTDRRTK